ncbi:MAG: Eco57I restriction-modification methylase domain-containing protein [Spirosoma sp.]|nr:Eco57I restriction-modification methylase domain-containing protein [Spirosoma sp.]
MNPIPNYNPDVLTCLANLSNDEVFTPPSLANQLLDLLPQTIWQDPNARFLDPVSKSGVFLREIAKRLLTGLKSQFPDQQERVNHIYKNQLFGIAITELTGLLSRRSVYCSKTANGRYSVCNTFKNEQGNLIYTRVEHTWKNEKCLFCGISQQALDRGDDLETYAYQFIHTENPDDIFKMKFDVIIGNPPYQLSDGGPSKSASPIYNLFIEQAKKLNPRYLTMIIPSRWFTGGKGLDSFREAMLNDNRLKKIVDFPDASDVFPGVDIAGGICYFLWEHNYAGPCEVTNVHKGVSRSSTRPLNEFSSFIRHGTAVPIIKKVQAKKEKNMSVQVSARKPFGLATNVRPTKKGDLILRWTGGEGPFDSKLVTSGGVIVDKWKVITSYASFDHGGQPGSDGKRKVFSKIDILPPNTICTESYLVIGAYDDRKQAENLVGYMKTKFFRFLIAQISLSQHITKDRYVYVPIQNADEEWTDEKLYTKYGLSEEEIAFIDAMIRPMD